MSTYQASHPWIKFTSNFRDVSPELWLLLGEAASECAHIAGVPLRPVEAQHLHQLYLAKGVLATTAIEGNTLSEEQVLQHLKGELKLPASQGYLAQEINNIVTACNLIGQDLQTSEGKLSSEQIKHFNALVLKGLPHDPGITPGAFRTGSVVVGNVYRGAPPEDCPLLVDRLCEWLSSNDFSPLKGLETVYAIIKAVVAHLYLAWIHPFDDGNGRTSRLVEFYLLLHAGIPSPAAHLLSNHYNQTRTEYYRQLRNASASGGDILPFVHYAVRGLVDGLKEQLSRIRLQQWGVAWRNFVYETFREKTGKTSKRQRDLLLDLSDHDFVPAAKVMELTPRLAKEYAQSTLRTLQRDLDALEKMELLERSQKGVRARKEIILAFLPAQKRPNA